MSLWIQESANSRQFFPCTQVSADLVSQVSISVDHQNMIKFMALTANSNFYFKTKAIIYGLFETFPPNFGKNFKALTFLRPYLSQYWKEQKLHPRPFCNLENNS